MTIPLICNSCQAAFQLKDTLAGKRCRCPKCQAVLHVPMPPPTAAQKREGCGDVPASEPADPRQQLLRQILAAFQADLSPSRRTRTYRLSMLLVAAAMLLLPLLYLALVASIVFLVGWHAIRR